MPGSPFELHVVPGPAYPLSTSIPPLKSPLCGYVKSDASIASCLLKLPTRDKMGNACVTGGASVTCAFVNSEHPSQLQTLATDCGDGTFTLEWWVKGVGEYDVAIKMDGLHILGSPTRMVIYKDEEEYKVHDGEERAIAAAKKAQAEMEAKERARLEVLAAPCVQLAVERVIDEELAEAIAYVHKERELHKFERYQAEMEAKRLALEEGKKEEESKGARRDAEAKKRMEEKKAKEARKKAQEDKEKAELAAMKGGR